MHCIHCGKPLAENSNFCPYCGRSQIQTEEQQPTAVNDPFSGKCHPSVKRNITIAGLSVAAATILTLVLFVVLVATSAVRDHNHVAPWEKDIITEEGTGNTADNIRNDGYAVTGNAESDAFYLDVDRLLYRDTNGNDSEITYSFYGYYYYLNYANDYLYFLEYDEDYTDCIVGCDPDTGWETYLYESDEDIFFFTVIGSYAYFVTEEAAYRADLEFEEVTELFTIDGAALDIAFTEEGICYRSDKAGVEPLYRRDLDGNDPQKIIDCLDFCIDGADLYTYGINEESGKAEICRSDLNGENKEAVYTFDGSSIVQIDSMLAQDGMIYCTLQRLGEDTEEDAIGQRYEICTLDTATGTLSAIVTNRSARMMPYYGLNLAGKWLFYWDETNPYHIQSIPLEQTSTKAKKV